MSCAAVICGLAQPVAAQQWLIDANQRIEQYRKADLTVRVVDSANQPVPDADVRVEMKRHTFGFGTAVPASWINNTSANGVTFREKLLENFNQVVFENDLKWPAWTGVWGGFNWTATQQAMDWLDANNLPIRGHYLSWATWSGSDAWGTSHTNPPQSVIDSLPERLLAHITDEATIVGNRVFEWDVINHPVGWLNDTYENRVPSGLEFYADIINHARSVAPEGMPMWINEDDIIAGGSRANDYERIIDYLIDHRAAPDGIGFQSHFIQEWGRVTSSSPQQVYNRIDRFADKGVPLRSTEFDIDVGNDEAWQAQLMHDYLTVMFSHPAMEAVTMWGFWQGTHWRPNAALYRTDWSEKPALAAYQDLVFNDWWTNALGNSDELGEYLVRGYKGEYDITVDFNGVEYVLQAVLNDDMSVTVSLPFSIGLPGDYNNDGLVDVADYVVWRNGGPLLNETVSPGTNDQADYDEWQANFGATGANGSSNTTIAGLTVPEPQSLFLLATLGLILLSGYGRAMLRTCVRNEVVCVSETAIRHRCR